MVPPKPRSAIFRPQIQEFQGSISDSESGQFPLSLGTASPVSALCFGESELSTWEGAVPLGVGMEQSHWPILLNCAGTYSLWCL